MLCPSMKVTYLLQLPLNSLLHHFEKEGPNTRCEDHYATARQAPSAWPAMLSDSLPSLQLQPTPHTYSPSQVLDALKHSAFFSVVTLLVPVLTSAALFLQWNFHSLPPFRKTWHLSFVKE